MRQGLLTLALLCAVTLGAAVPADAARFTVASKATGISGRDAKQRMTVSCPGKKLPFGGGMSATPGISADGEGAYPHSYERLGVQHGFHVTPVLYSPAGNPTPRSVRLQVICGPRIGQVAAPHATTFVGPGNTRTTVAKCPKGQRAYSGGFQRTDFISRGGNYVTESKRLENGRGWTVTGHAFGNFGGELTAIAYCLRSKRQLVRPVAATSGSAGSGVIQAQTPSCPRRTDLVAGGFSFNGSQSAFFGDGIVGGNDSWTANGYVAFGAPTAITAIGYCMPRSVSSRNHGRQKGKHGGKGGSREVRAPKLLDAALKVAISTRISDPNNCFPGPADLAAALNRKGINAGVAQRPGGINRAGKVYVIAASAACDRVHLGLRTNGSVFLLDSKSGKVTKK